MKNIDKVEFDGIAESLMDALVMDVKCGEGTGSIFTMDIKTKNHGLCCLMAYCSWKLLDTGTISCSWKDTELHIAKSMLSLKGRIIDSVRVLPGGDLRMLLDKTELLLLSDAALFDNDDTASDYFIISRDIAYVCLRGLYYID